MRKVYPELEQFDEILRVATASIADEYFRLPVANGSGMFRERVYCYELYHQLSRLWPNETPLKINGEIDKGGHPFLETKEALAASIPDFLVHVPGTMANNFAIVEVKPGNARARGFEKDLNTLANFVQHWGYLRGISLIYGDLGKSISMAIQRAEDRGTLTPLEIWHHSRPGQPALLVRRIGENPVAEPGLADH